MGYIIHTNGIDLHYLDYAGKAPALVLVHGLTANAHCFEAVVGSLAPKLRVIAPDMRGRGASTKPADGYTMGDHAADVLGLLDGLGLERVIMGGHSFGGLLSLYLAAHAPERVAAVVLVDAAISAASERTRALIRPALARLEQTYASFEAYLELIRAAPYYHAWPWDPAVESYYQADVEPAAEGRLRARARPAAITAAADGVIAEPWRDHLARVACPVLMIHASGPYGPPEAPAIINQAQADETCTLLADCRYVHVPGNHQTMLYGAGARATAAAILSFALALP